VSVKTEKTLPLYASFEEISLGFVERFLFPTVLGALGLFIIWAAIGLKYHPASRLRAGASNGMHGKT
jgi:hypothetical protein